MLKEIIISVQSYFRAYTFIRANSLWKWIIFPGVVYSILLIASMYFFSKSANYFIQLINVKSGLKLWIDMQGDLIGFLFAIGGVMVWIVLMMLYFSWFKHIWLVLGSPVYSYLSQKVSSIIEEKPLNFSYSVLSKDFVRSMRLSGRNILWQTVYLVTLIIISFIPVIGWITPLMALLVECYYFGYAMHDYSCARQHLPQSKSMAYISQHKGLSIGNGLVFYLLHTLVIVGWVIAPAFAIVAATLSLHAEEDQGYEVKDVVAEVNDAN